MTIPAGAQRSEDGNYWWDEQNQQWQLIDQNQQGNQAQAGQGDPAQAAPGQAAGGTPQEQARAEAGLPVEVHTATPEQSQPYVGEPYEEVAALDSGQTETPEMEQEEQA